MIKAFYGVDVYGRLAAPSVFKRKGRQADGVMDRAYQQQRKQK